MSDLREGEARMARSTPILGTVARDFRIGVASRAPVPISAVATVRMFILFSMRAQFALGGRSRGLDRGAVEGIRSQSADEKEKTTEIRCECS
jgi:hypothetical protein